MQMGWGPARPTQWHMPQTAGLSGDSWMIDATELSGFPDADIPHQLLLDIDTSICHQLWTCASKHHGGEGLQHGVDN
eukprot:4263320-Pyramimonas_sp.AAC.1